MAQKAVTFEAASELVTIVGQNGTEVKLESGSQNDLAGNGASLGTREVANVREPGGAAAGAQYAGRVGGGSR